MSAVDSIVDLDLYVDEVASEARMAARALAVATGERKNRFLRRAAEQIRSRTSEILSANQMDVSAAPQFGLNAAAIDRLKLSAARLEGAAAALEQVADLPDPVGE